MLQRLNRVERQSPGLLLTLLLFFHPCPPCGRPCDERSLAATVVDPHSVAGCQRAAGTRQRHLRPWRHRQPLLRIRQVKEVHGPSRGAVDAANEGFETLSAWDIPCDTGTCSSLSPGLDLHGVESNPRPQVRGVLVKICPVVRRPLSGRDGQQNAPAL